MIIRDSYPVQNYGRVIKRPRRGMGYEGVNCNWLIHSSQKLRSLHQNSIMLRQCSFLGAEVNKYCETGMFVKSSEVNDIQDAVTRAPTESNNSIQI
jgi:antirestriction protein ArdC